MRRVLLAMALLGLLPVGVWGQAESDPPAGTVQVLDFDAEGRPLLARVALTHALPGFAEAALQLGGTWSYLIRDGDGVMVFDVGPRFPLGYAVIPFAAWKGWAPRLDGNARILQALEAVWPGRAITAIVLSHWHPDHTEDAPALQQLAAERWGRVPPLRIGAPDREARWRGPIRAGAEAVFLQAGFTPAEWEWGPDLRDGEALGLSGYRSFAMPGHTEGNMALISDDRRISLGPLNRVEPPRVGWWAEDLETYRATALRFYHATFGYRHYTTHPARDQEPWPGAPTMHKQPAHP